MRGRFHLEALETRTLLALQTLNFADYPVKLDQLAFLTPNLHTPTTGFSYAVGSGAGQRQNKNGITWPDANYYEMVLGTGGFDALNAWPMRPTVVYSTPKPGGWQSNGWNWFQDMAEGAVDIDDAARAVVAYADRYLLDSDASAFQRAKDVLSFVGYMTTRQGQTYNFAWLDAPAMFTTSAQQSTDAHFAYRVEYNKRTAYPTASPDASWNDPLATPSQIVGGSANPQPAIGFLAHAKFSIYMNDLRDANGNDVALTYNGPLYNSLGNVVSYKTGIRQTQTTSTLQFGFDEIRSIQAFTRGLAMLQKFAHDHGGLIGDNLYFARFCENHLNRLLQNFQRWMAANPGGVDSKMAAVALDALAGYRQLTGTANGLGNGRYLPRLAPSSNTAETTDDALSTPQLDALLNTLATTIQSTLLKTTDWRNGIFIDDTSGNWESWGEYQIAALARAYSMKRALGQTDAQAASLLDDATYAADNFYGKEAWHFADSSNNLARTRERIVRIQGWSAKYHTNSDQAAYMNSSMVVGLEALARAWADSGRTQTTAKRDLYLESMRRVGSWFIGNNSQLAVLYDARPTGGGAFQGIGSAFDGIGFGSPPSSAHVNRNSGAESNIETVWAWTHLKHAIDEFGLSNSFTFENGTAALVMLPAQTIATPRRRAAALLLSELTTQ